MKKTLSLLAVALLLIACSAASTESSQKQEERFVSNTYDHINSEVHILNDTKTGCKYLIVYRIQTGTAITPLLKSDGTPDCKE